MRIVVIGRRAVFLVSTTAALSIAADRDTRLQRYLGRKGTAIAARAMELAHRLTGRGCRSTAFHQRVIGEDFFFSTRAIERDLGYAPLVHPDEGLRRSLAWLDGVAI